MIALLAGGRRDRRQRFKVDVTRYRDSFLAIGRFGLLAYQQSALRYLKSYLPHPLDLGIH